MTESGDPLTASHLQERAVRGTIATALHVAVSVPLGLLVSVVVARSLGPERYGTLAYLTAATTIGLSISELGVPSAILQWGAAAAARRDRSEVVSLIRGSIGFRLTIQAPLMLVFGAVLLGGSSLILHLGYFTAIVLTAALSAPALVLAIENRTATLAAIAVASGVALQITMLVAIALTDSPQAIWITRLLATALLAGITFAWVAAPDRRASLSPRLPQMPEGFWRFALLIGAAGMITLLVYSRSEVFVLRFYDQARELGWFALAFGLSQQLTTPVDAMLGPLLPASAALIAAHPEYAPDALARATRFSSLVTGFIAAAILPAVALAVPLAFGKSYSRVAGMVLVLGLVSTFQSIFQPVNALLLARRRAALILKVSAFALFLDIAVALALAPAFGAWGAITGNVAGQLASIGLFARAELRSNGIGFREFIGATRPWLVALPALIVAVAAAYVVDTFSPVLAPCIAFGFGSTVYIGLVRLVGGAVTASDVRALLGALPARVRAPVGRLLGAVTIREGEAVS